MEVMEILRISTFAIGYVIIIFSILPLLRSVYWFIRVFDYPRSQKFWINLVILLLFIFTADFSNTHDKIFLIAICLNIVYLLTQIWNYTPLASIQMKKNGDTKLPKVKIVIANVFQDNKKYDLCHTIINKHSPDIVLLVETDEDWSNKMSECLKDYPHRVLKPQSNTYGMVLYSKFEIVEHSIRFLVESDIPSITADIKHPNGKLFRLYCLHPKPPVPNESTESTERDAEILMIGKEAKKCKLPVIVAGDLNDVAWSYTTNLFLKTSGLLDPRIGRGFYSTFHANYRLLRWPLDHVFCSSHFYLHHLQRLPSIGSDHFPILIEVSLMPYEVEENVQAQKVPDEKDFELANEKIEAAL